MRRHRLTALIAATASAGVLVGVLVPTAAQAASASQVRSASSAALFGSGQYTSPTSEAAKAAAALASSDPAGARAAATIAKHPVATWLGDWTTGTTLTRTIDQATAGAAATGTTAVFVTYAIPARDCGGYSAGGFDEASYDAWIDQIAARLVGKRAAVVVEPDSLAMLSNGACTADLDQQRYRILSREVAAFTAAGVPAYLDAGNSNWVPAATMADRLRQAGVQNARGFSTNVSNYYPVAQEQAYAQRLSALTDGSHYVIDTSRNGTGWRGTWCNAPGAGLGTTPRVAQDGTALDALLWVKTPGASDGTCNGGPAAGAWFSTYAQALVANAAPSTSTAPRSTLDAATVAPAGISVRGWALDADAPGTPVTVAIRVDGSVVRTLTADRARPDVARATGAGSAHGFEGVVPAGNGKHTVCAVARNIGPGPDTTSACRTVTVPASAPMGRFDSVGSDTIGRVTVAGWAFDRDAVASSVTVVVRVDGTRVSDLLAAGARPDVDRVHGAGPAHGYATTLAAPSGRRTICVTATGIGAGGDAALGCRTLTVR